MSSTASPTPSPTNLLDQGSGRAQSNQGISLNTFFASLVGGLAIFGVEFLLFLIIKGKFSRIYLPRTYLVPEKERIKAPPKGLWQWVLPIFQTSNSDFIQKCGLDAYFFLRYLRTLLKIFIPLAVLILPILLCSNAVLGRGPHFADHGSIYDKPPWSNVNGLDIFGWGNVRPTKVNRYWAHLVLAVVVVVYTCFVFFDELRGYIRLRQAYLTSPQHRLRASATTVLVTAVPRKWCTFDALNGLYDVFPGGIRNIWINRNFDELNDKVKQRDKLARSLESAETALIRNAKKAHIKKMKKEAKKAGGKASQNELSHAADDKGRAMADTGGLSSGNPHQVRHTVDEALDYPSNEPSRESSPAAGRKKPLVPIPVVGEGLEAVGHGIGTIGKTVFGGLKKVGKDVDDRLETTGGFVPESAPSEHRSDSISGSSHQQTYSGATDAAAYTEDDYRPPPSSESRRPVLQEGFNDTHDTRDKFKGYDGNIDGPAAIAAGIELHDNPQQLGKVKSSRKAKAMFWKPSKNVPFGIPSPTPHGYEGSEFPMNSVTSSDRGEKRQVPTSRAHSQDEGQGRGTVLTKMHLPLSGGNEKKCTEYPPACTEDYDPEEGEPVWKKYLKEKDRETMRLPLFGWQWMPPLPLIGQKVDTIDYCRKEVARLNLEIEHDQKDPEKYPLMNSAFIQFNHQVAAHMACQAVSHHTPNQMVPRVVEISPDDVIWDNMSIKWWESYVRTGAVITLVLGLVIAWGIPVAFTGLLSSVDYLSTHYRWLRWLSRAPNWVLSIIQGILPQALLAALLAILPLLLRFLAKSQGDYTGMAVELSVQMYYFAFLFVQVFLVVSISSGISKTIKQLYSDPGNVASILASNLPKASNYFFSYLLLQALSVSAGALVQVGGLIKWFILAPILDSTARQKWTRQTKLPDVQWGTFFPVYTNLAVIGIIYSIISPLILIFNIITFSLFWLVYRYNTLYVTKFRFDTGGLLYPTAINQLFTGLYFMELCLIGLFLLVRSADEKGTAYGTPCKGQAIIMIVVLIGTGIYQWLLNRAFSPLFRYLPITLEDEAVIRDEEFARAQEKRWRLDENEQPGDDINDVLEERARRSAEEDERAEEIEMKEIEARRQRGRLDPRNIGKVVPNAIGNLIPSRGNWADRSRNEKAYDTSKQSNNNHNEARRRQRRQRQNGHRPTDLEAQKTGGDRIGEALFSGLNDEIEDLTPEERDQLVRRAFQHQALRARRPVIWIPRDELGVSDDEIRRTQKLSKHIWISNEYTGLDGKGRVVYRRSPPDFSEVDLIEL